jgi:dephospho-CoA kinase
MITIGITGTIGAGKGTVVDYLVKEKGYKHFSSREFILREVSARGLEPIRDNIRLVANDLRKQHEPSYIISELLKEAKAYGGNSIIESIRAIGELDLLKSDAENFYLLAVDADINLRYERIVARNLSTDHVSFEKFVDDERKELDAKEPWDMNIKACMAQANFTLENNGSVEEFHKKIEEVLQKIGK